jgi:hypothetical protein
MPKDADVSDRRLPVLPPRVALAAVMALATLLGSTLPGCGGDKPAAPTRKSDGTVHLLLLNRLQAMAEGVPCNPADVPPLAGAAEARDRLAAQGESAALVIVGDTLRPPREGLQGDVLDAAREGRAGVQLEALAAAKPQAWVPGAGDLSPEHLEQTLQLAAQAGIPVLLSNVSAPAHPQIRSSLVLQGGTLRVGLLGVVPTRIADMEAVRKGEQGDERLQDLDLPGASVLPIHETVARLAAELRQQEQVDLVVLLSGLSTKANGALSDTGVDVVLGTTEPKTGTANVLFVDNVMFASALPGGEEVGHTMLRLVGGSKAIKSLFQVHTLPDEIARQESRLESLGRQYGTSDVDELARLSSPGFEAAFKDKVELLRENEAYVQQLESYTGSAIDHYAEPLQPLAASDAVQAALARQGAALQAALDAPALGPVPVPEGTPTIPLASACDKCHAAQADFWRSTAHARAMETLAASSRQRDPACLKCHAAGFGDALGWTDPRLDAPLGAVSCWSCHRTTRQHAEKKRQYVDPSVAGIADAVGMNCEGCHVERRSPGFDRSKALAQVSCPPMRDDEPPLLLARQDALDQIQARKDRGDAEPRDDYLKARALIGLGRPEGWAELDRYSAANTSDVGLALEIARFADRHGRSAHALELLAAFRKHAPGDEDALYGHVELLLHARDPAARNPAQAVQFLALVLPADATNTPHTNVPLRALQIEALIEAGHTAEAAGLLDVLLRDHGRDSRLLQLGERLQAKGR